MMEWFSVRNAGSELSDWFENDDLFREQLAVGHQWARRVADRMVTAGIPASLTPTEWRNDIHDRKRFENEADIIVDLPAGPIVIESKSRKLRFTGPHDYPYGTAFVDTVEGWNKKDPRPVAVVLTSQVTGESVVVPVRTSQEHWTFRKVHDRVRNIDVVSYECPKRLLLPFERLTEWLKFTADSFSLV